MTANFARLKKITHFRFGIEYYTSFMNSFRVEMRNHSSRLCILPYPVVFAQD